MDNLFKPEALSFPHSSSCGLTLVTTGAGIVKSSTRPPPEEGEGDDGGSVFVGGQLAEHLALAAQAHQHG